MISLRMSEADAKTLEEGSTRLGKDRSEIIRSAIRRHMALVAAEDDVDAWTRKPLTPAEVSMSEVAFWGPDEDWSDWVDA